MVLTEKVIEGFSDEGPTVKENFYQSILDYRKVPISDDLVENHSFNSDNLGKLLDEKDRYGVSYNSIDDSVGAVDEDDGGDEPAGAGFYLDPELMTIACAEFRVDALLKKIKNGESIVKADVLGELFDYNYYEIEYLSDMVLSVYTNLDESLNGDYRAPYVLSSFNSDKQQEEDEKPGDNEEQPMVATEILADIGKIIKDNKKLKGKAKKKVA